MRGLRHRIEAIIEEVNHEIRVDLGIEQPNPELKTIDTLDVSDVEKTPERESEESEEAKAFEKVLDEICASFDEEAFTEEEEPEDETNDELEEEPDSQESPDKALAEILNNL